MGHLAQKYEKENIHLFRLRKPNQYVIFLKLILEIRGRIEFIIHNNVNNDFAIIYQKH